MPGGGITQYPWKDIPCPVPSGDGDQGIGGGLDPGPGEQGIINSPWTDPFVPTPTNMAESGPFGNPSRFSVVDGSTREGESLANDITMPPLRTIDKK